MKHVWRLIWTVILIAVSAFVGAILEQKQLESENRKLRDEVAKLRGGYVDPN